MEIKKFGNKNPSGHGQGGIVGTLTASGNTSIGLLLSVCMFESL